MKCEPSALHTCTQHKGAMIKVIFSRKGFDSQNGGMASPIYDSAPISLPIPYPSSTIAYEDQGLGKIIYDLSKGSSLFKNNFLDFC